MILRMERASLPCPFRVIHTAQMLMHAFHALAYFVFCTTSGAGKLHLHMWQERPKRCEAVPSPTMTTTERPYSSTQCKCNCVKYRSVRPDSRRSLAPSLQERRCCQLTKPRAEQVRRRQVRQVHRAHTLLDYSNVNKLQFRVQIRDRLTNSSVGGFDMP